MATKDKSKDPWYSQVDFGFGPKMIDRAHKLINPHGTIHLVRKGPRGLRLSVGQLI